MSPNCFVRTSIWTGIVFCRTRRTGTADAWCIWGCRSRIMVLDAPLPEAVVARLSTDSDVQMFSHRMPATLLANYGDGVSEEQAVAFYFSLKDSWRERWWFGLMLCRDQSPMVTDSTNLVSLAHLPPASRSARSSPSPDHKRSVPIHNSARYQSLDRARLVGSFCSETWETIAYSHTGYGSACWCSLWPLSELLCRRNRKHMTVESRAWSRDVGSLHGTPDRQSKCSLIWKRRMLEFSLRLATLNPS